MDSRWCAHQILHLPVSKRSQRTNCYIVCLDNQQMIWRMRKMAVTFHQTQIRTKTFSWTKSYILLVNCKFLWNIQIWSELHLSTVGDNSNILSKLCKSYFRFSLYSERKCGQLQIRVSNEIYCTRCSVFSIYL